MTGCVAASPPRRMLLLLFARLLDHILLVLKRVGVVRLQEMVRMTFSAKKTQMNDQIRNRYLSVFCPLVSFHPWFRVRVKVGLNKAWGNSLLKLRPTIPVSMIQRYGYCLPGFGTIASSDLRTEWLYYESKEQHLFQRQ